MQHYLDVYVNNRHFDRYPCKDKATAEKIVKAFDHPDHERLHGIYSGSILEGGLGWQTYPIIVR